VITQPSGLPALPGHLQSHPTTSPHRNDAQDLEESVKMRIGCLQFAPQVGDVSNNLTRADAVLAKADPMEVENLDLLVLPEMAFSGKQEAAPT